MSQQASGGLVAIEYNVLSDVWMGGGVAFAKSDVGIANTPAVLDNLLGVTYESRSLRLSGEWDTRSDTFFPLGGTLATLDVDVVRNEAAGRSTRFTRYSLGFVAFAGIGGVYGEVVPFEQDDALPAAGVGLRWRLTHENRINFAVDYARGRDDQTLTISVGEAF